MNFEKKDHHFGETVARYMIEEKTRGVYMLLLPAGSEEQVFENYASERVDGEFWYNNDRVPGSLVHLHLSRHPVGGFGNSFKMSKAALSLKFREQKKIEEKGKTVVETLLEADEGYGVIHRLIHYGGENAFEVGVSFYNNTGKTVTLELLSSAALDGLSPYLAEEGSEDLFLHRFGASWATEGRHMCASLAELNLEKAWGGSFESKKFGAVGSRSVDGYFPYAALEDRKNGVTWGMKLACNSSWQFEATRYGNHVSLSCGLADLQFGSWFKHIENGGRFDAPTAYIAAVKGDIADVSNALLKPLHREIDAYGEQGMPIVFNEWCTSWGKPTHGNMLALADALQESKTRYLVMDAGWFRGEIGDWDVNEESFPGGIKKTADEIRKKGFIPGIWMEFEVTAEGARHFGKAFDGMHVKKDGAVFVGRVMFGRYESFWDFTNPETVKLLDEKVIRFLKENGFGYLKVDYNAAIGVGCDGAESLGEGLRQQMEAVRAFFVRIKKEIPGIIIENCASGGYRAEPSMMGVTAMTSFSDAHECFEFPIVAANMAYLIPARQSQVWSVLRPEFSKAHMAYSISAGFLGRLCWSGDFTKLSDAQMNEVLAAEKLYDRVADIIKYGDARIFRTDGVVYRNPKGTQAVVRTYKNEALLVYHGFLGAKPLPADLSGWEIVEKLYDVELDDVRDGFGNVILLRKR